jgi:hypothetical protein
MKLPPMKLVTSSNRMRRMAYYVNLRRVISSSIMAVCHVHGRIQHMSIPMQRVVVVIMIP